MSCLFHLLFFVFHLLKSAWGVLEVARCLSDVLNIKSACDTEYLSLSFMNLKVGEHLLKQILTVWMIVMDTDRDRKIQTQQVCSVHERKGSHSSGTLLA